MSCFWSRHQQAPGNHLASVGLTASSETTFNARLFTSRSARQIVSSSPPQRAAWKEGYLPEPYFASREEMAIYILAHELRHVWQWRLHRGISERDACAYGIHILRRWRRGTVRAVSACPMRCFSPGGKNRNSIRSPTHPGEPFGAGNPRASESDDRGKVANVPYLESAIGAAAREQILAHLAKFDTK